MRTYVTLPLPLFLLVLAAAAVVSGLLVATAAERLTRVRVQQAHGERHRHGAPNRHEPASAPFVPGELAAHHARAAQLARQAVQPNPAALLHVHVEDHRS